MMKKDSSTESWGQKEITEEWIKLAQNILRINFIMPFTFQQLGDVAGKAILDIGCGEGGYSRELTRRGATVTAVDCAEHAIKYCISKADEAQLKITYHIRNSCDLYDIADNTFDIVLSSMMLMDCEDFEGTVKEITRVLKPGGKLFASVCHPCFDASPDGSGGILRQGDGLNRQIVVSNYFEPKEWESPIKPGGGAKVIMRHRTFEDYFKTFIKCGLTITDLHEPVPTEEQAAIDVNIAWMRKIPRFLFWELNKYRLEI